jgi:hypothetical protein
MPGSSIDFRVTQLEARVPDGLPFVWHGLEVSTGPLAFELDEKAESMGVMDYGRGLFAVEYNVRLHSTAFTATFCALGVDPRMVSPVRVKLRAEGEILPDHSFTGGLRGQCQVEHWDCSVPASKFAAKSCPASDCPSRAPGREPTFAEISRTVVRLRGDSAVTKAACASSFRNRWEAARSK